MEKASPVSRRAQAKHIDSILTWTQQSLNEYHRVQPCLSAISYEKVGFKPFAWFCRVHCQQLPVRDPQLASLAASTHMNVSAWSPYQTGANYFSSGVQPGPRLGSFPFSLRLLSPAPSSPSSCAHPRHFLLWGVANASVYFNMMGKTDAGRSCTEVQSDKDLAGRRAWLFNPRWAFREAKRPWW